MAKMNYLQILVDGITDANNRDFLDAYINRELVKAKGEGYSANEFFSGCSKSIASIELKLEDQLSKTKLELNLYINALKNRKTIIEDSNGSIINEKQRQDRTRKTELKLANINLGQVSVQGSTSHKINYSDVKELKKALLNIKGSLKQKASSIKQGRQKDKRHNFDMLIIEDKREDYRRQRELFISAFKDKIGLQLAIVCWTFKELEYFNNDRIKNAKVVFEAIAKELNFPYDEEKNEYKGYVGFSRYYNENITNNSRYTEVSYEVKKVLHQLR